MWSLSRHTTPTWPPALPLRDSENHLYQPVDASQKVLKMVLSVPTTNRSMCVLHRVTAVTVDPGEATPPETLNQSDAQPWLEFQYVDMMCPSEDVVNRSR